MRACPSPRGQTGAITILAAGALLAVILVTALAVDVGRIFWEQRKLQMVADLAALEASLAMGNCAPAGGSTPLGRATAAARTSALRNGYTGDMNALRVRVGEVFTDGSGRRHFRPTPGTPFAVEVRAPLTIPRSLIIPGELGGDLDLDAVAVAGTETVGTLEVGSFLARIDTTTSPLLNAILGGLLGTSLNLDAVSYRGIADAHLTLLDLIEADATVGTVDELLDLEIGIRDFVVLAANALSRYPDQHTVAATLLNVADAITVDSDLHLRLGDLLQVDLPAGNAALNAQINVLDLVMLGAQVANARHAVEVGLPINIPGVATASLDLYIIDPPQIAVGPAGRDPDGEWITRARSAQINLELHLGVLGLLSLNPGSGLINLDLVVDAPVTRAGFERFECRDQGHAAVVGHVAQALRIGVGRFDDMSKLNPEIVPSRVVDLLGLLGITAHADLGLGQSPQAPGEMIFETIPSTQSTDNNALGSALSNLLYSLANNLVVEFDDHTILGALLGLLLQPVLTLLGLGSTQGLLDLVTALLTPILTALDPLLEFLLNLLGIKLAGADISVIDINVGRPELLI